MDVQAVKDCTLSTAVSLWRIVSVVNSCKLTTLGKVSRLHYMYVKNTQLTIVFVM